ncbi:hypothetical protein CapIbe_016172 [Capra ibex]
MAAPQMREDPALPPPQPSLCFCSGKRDDQRSRLIRTPSSFTTLLKQESYTDQTGKRLGLSRSDLTTTKGHV